MAAIAGYKVADALYRLLGLKETEITRIVISADYSGDFARLWLECIVTTEMVEKMQASELQIEVGDTVIQKGTLTIDEKGHVSVEEK